MPHIIIPTPSKSTTQAYDIIVCIYKQSRSGQLPFCASPIFHFEIDLSFIYNYLYTLSPYRLHQDAFQYSSPHYKNRAPSQPSQFSAHSILIKCEIQLHISSDLLCRTTTFLYIATSLCATVPSFQDGQQQHTSPHPGLRGRATNADVHGELTSFPTFT